MNRTFILCAAAFLISFAWAPVETVAQDESLTADETAWLKQVIGAGWSGVSSANGVSVTARNARLYTAHFEPVLEKWESLSEEQQAALSDVVRITISEQGWLDHFPVAPDTYSLGYAKGPNNLQMIMRDSDGEIVDVDGMWLSGVNDMKPRCYVTGGEGGTKVLVKWGQAEFDWIYLSEAAHEEAAGEVTEYREGNVAIYTDLPKTKGLRQLAKDAAKGVAANAAICGRELPEDYVYRIYIMSGEGRYEALDTVLTAGHFDDHGAFTSWRTRWSYLRHSSHWGDDYRVPSAVTEVVIHELHHQYIYNAFPCLRYMPGWFTEALAELCAQEGIALADKEAAHNYARRRDTELNFYRDTGRLGHAEDMLTGKEYPHIGSYYTMMWHVGRALIKQPEDLKAILNAADEWQLGSGMNETIRREFDARYPSLSQIIKDALDDDLPLYVTRRWGYADEWDGVFEINTDNGRGGFAVLNQPVKQNKLTVSGEFRWNENDDSPQADVVFAYGAGEETERFMKAAIMPARIQLFTMLDGDWETIGNVAYETNLEIGSKAKPVWHEFTLTYDATTGAVRVDTTDGRWATFDVEDYTPARDTYCGFGTYDSVIWFRNVEVS